MSWEKKICFRLTTRRIVGAILMATTVVNLVIVGVAASNAAPTLTPTLTPSLATQLPVTEFITPATLASETSTSTSILTITIAPTETSTDLPKPILCITRFYWPTYRVQPGDTLYSLAIATGSTVDELILANCLP